ATLLAVTLFPLFHQKGYGHTTRRHPFSAFPSKRAQPHYSPSPFFRFSIKKGTATLLAITLFSLFHQKGY
ncbi:hypothetical protein, partial [Bacillus sp. SD088]|uniref:hypothetical protein n=1 Tax=Bacillus sp. SD088 TaxID=2782012 RepID=UPI001A96014B